MEMRLTATTERRGLRLVTSMRRWMAALLLAGCYLGTWAQHTYVLAVGIADYRDINDLRYTTKDALVFAKFMETQGAEVTLLLDSEASHAGILSAFRLLAARAGKDDTLIFFFSGHGYQGGFCCWDMRILKPGSSVEMARRAGNRLEKANRTLGGLSYAEMQILFRNSRAGKKLVFADACHSGGFNRGNSLDLSVQAARKGEVVFVMSSELEETSLEHTEAHYGCFTYFTLQGFGGKADTDRNKQVTLKEYRDYMYPAVVEYGDRMGCPQHPEFWGRFDWGMPIFWLK